MIKVNLLEIKTTGASKATAAQDSYKPGVEASHQMAETDWIRLEKYRVRFEAIAQKYGIIPSLLLAIASRESRAGNVLNNGWGDQGNAWGVMQVDKRFHQIQGLDSPFSQSHIDQAAGIFFDGYQEVKKKFPTWSEDLLLKGAIAAYNFGVRNVKTPEGINKGTTGDDYADDVIARAQYYEKRYYKQDLIQEIKIKAKVKTFLKKEIKQALELKPEQKKEIEIGTSYDVLTCTEGEKNHLKILLDYEAGEWYIFSPHWEFEGYIPPQSKETLSSKIPDNLKIQIQESVGNNGQNNPSDVLIIKSRLNSLGFGDFDESNSSVDQKFINAIKLFQSIIQGSTSLIGDGRVDVSGLAINWMNAKNAPRWRVMTANGEGFMNVEALETWDFHDYGCSWLDDAICEIAANYEQNYRKGRKDISLMLVNDVSLRHGGNTPDHAGHECGNAVDLRLPVKGGDLKTVISTWNSIRYDRITALAMLREINKHPLFKRAYFNDFQAIGAGLSQRASGHDNHIHFEIKPPKIIN